ncbi:MAG TPA: DUF3097 family protein [Streptosporangiaceae bacterium]
MCRARGDRAGAAPKQPTVSASGSFRVAGHTARTARDSLMQAEGIHDAELVEPMWEHDPRVQGVVVLWRCGALDLRRSTSCSRSPATSSVEPTRTTRQVSAPP